ncbi:hypothetical protein [Variovorax sp. 3P27G3]|uniref:hypothetical protein n=1 Tax=Variovorax sp. 3P27G3 TaxID=2502214 RepID=UPI0010F816D5|nr:hypothetical protein [Variovorax sp. 3P27G3]
MKAFTARALRKKLLTPPPPARRKNSTTLAIPYSRKMRGSLYAYRMSRYSLWIELEFDRSVVSFNLEPPVWTFTDDANEEGVVIDAVSLDVANHLTLHFSRSNAKILDAGIERIKNSQELSELNAGIKIWDDLEKWEKLDRTNKNTLLRYLWSAELVVDAQIEKFILSELNDVRKLSVWDFFNKLKAYDPEEIKSAIANLIVEGKIYVDMTRRLSPESEVSLKEIFHA